MQGLQALGFNPKGASRNGELHFDWNDPTTWSAALNGIDSIYLTYYPDLAIPKAPEDISKFCALAKMKGIKHITVLSGRAEPAAQVCENIIQQSGISWTVVRASWFNQNFSEGLFRQFIMDRRIALPVDEVTEPFRRISWPLAVLRPCSVVRRTAVRLRPHVGRRLVRTHNGSRECSESHHKNKRAALETAALA